LTGKFTGGAGGTTNMGPGAAIAAEKYSGVNGELGFDCVLYSHINSISADMTEMARFSAEDGLAIIAQVPIAGDSDNNIFVGSSIPSSWTDGYGNSVFGDNSLQNITEGFENSIIGAYSGGGITEGFGNIIVGGASGITPVGDNNIIIGSYLSCGANLTSNSLNIGGFIQGSIGASHLRIGGSGSLYSGVALEVDSTTGAVLLPRMTTSQRNALSPVNGMMIYDTTQNAFRVYQNGAWKGI
jgi:hypothetical protein